MAKKNNNILGAVGSGKNSLFDIVKSVDKSTDILAESKFAVIDDYISTGSYILNAAFTGSLFKGVPTKRCSVYCGEKGTGKSYLALSVCREAQKKGYTPIYMDSEGAMDIDFITRLGCDPNNFLIKQVTTITEVSSYMANILKKVNEMSEGEKPKMLFVLDSLGNLTSDKELNDTIDANGKRDMTKQQEVKALFRVNATAIARAGAAFIVISHVYQTQDLFSKTIVSGGCLVPGSKIRTENGLMNIEDIKVGDKVLSHDSKYHNVLETFTFEKETYKITFSDDSVLECSSDHKFRIESLDYPAQWLRAEDIYINSKNNDNFNLDDIDIDCIHDYNTSSTKIIRIINIEKMEGTKTVHDICVEDVHTYITENEVINHNSGVNYNASVTMMLSTAKLDDKESDKIAEKKTGDYLKTGVIVTAKPEKSRFTIPQKVQFVIPFFKSPNPYIGLERYLNWTDFGVMVGEILDQKSYDKLSDGEKLKSFEMTDEKGNKCYAHEKESSRKIVVRHLGKELPKGDLWTSQVFTDELLHKMDELVIRPNFELPSNDTNSDIDELICEDED